MSTWIDFPENPQDYIGIVYLIQNLHPDATKTYYIGQKQLLKKTRLPANKSRKRPKIVWRDNGVEDYYGSSKELQEDVGRLGKGFFKRVVLECCTSKFQMSYAELKWQLEFDVLLDPKSYNGIINVRLGRVPTGYVDTERRRSNLTL